MRKSAVMGGLLRVVVCWRGGLLGAGSCRVLASGIPRLQTHIFQQFKVRGVSLGAL